eukprot:COSAG02_NODE_57_length_43668_cov_118.217196_25_plen_87_part_00
MTSVPPRAPVCALLCSAAVRARRGVRLPARRPLARYQPSRAWGNVRSAYARLHRGTAYAYSVPPGTGRPYAQRRVVAVIRLRNLQR